MTVILYAYNKNDYPSRVSAQESSALYKLGTVPEGDGEQVMFEDVTRRVEAATAMSHMYGLRGSSAFVLHDDYEDGSWKSYNMLKMENADDYPTTAVTIMWKVWLLGGSEGAKYLGRSYLTQMDVPTLMLITDRKGLLDMAYRKELGKLRKLTTGTGDTPDVRILENGERRLDAIFEGEPITLNTVSLARDLGCIDDLPSKR